MKLIIAGASGFVANEIIRQSLVNSSITSLILLSRRPVSPPTDLPNGTDTSKLQTVVLESYGSYPSEALKHLDGADGCIWY